MPKLTILITAAVVSVCVQTLVAIADEAPTLDVRINCHAIAPRGVRAAGCLADEQRARKVLVRQWSQFGPESKTRCIQMMNDIAGTQSYVELLSCLQDANAAKTLPKD